jgi:DNA (cytosine-5)-methyltransferase 1
MLWCFDALGYVAEWRVLNAADYGAPQKRRRVFILATRSGTRLGRALISEEDKHEWLQKKGFFANAFPAVQDVVHTLVPEPPHGQLYDDARRLSDRFKFDFLNSGVMVSRGVWTATVKPRPEPLVPLRSVLQTEVPDEFFVHEADLPRWQYLKGAKSERRQTPAGFQYSYSEGRISYPDRIDQPARTILTKEGGLAPSRFKHLIIDPQTGRYRVLTPVECERLNQFPDGWTEGIPTGRRYFCMGNALVVGPIERMGQHLAKWASLEESIALRPSDYVEEGVRQETWFDGAPNKVVAFSTA